MTLYISVDHESIRDSGEQYFSDSDPVYKTSYDSLGDLFKSLQEEYGRCVGKIHIDVASSSKEIGWIFESRREFQDCSETFLNRAWVTIHSKRPVKKTTYTYHTLDGDEIKQTRKEDA